jgi:hypothetical protein
MIYVTICGGCGRVLIVHWAVCVQVSLGVITSSAAAERSGAAR